jgi:CheY-like chemotaxis protein
LIEVPTAENALDELQNSEINLLVTAYSLPDMTGIQLGDRAIRESAGTPIIILASPEDPEVSASDLDHVPYTYLVRPVGEQFLRELRIGLDGEVAVAVQEESRAVSGGLELGPVPEIDPRQIRDHVITMMRETLAIGAIVADRLGRVVFSEGATGYFDKGVLAATLGPSFARTVDLRDLIDGNSWGMHYYDGDRYDLVALALGLHYFVALIFDGTKTPPFGPVMRYGRQEADAVIAKLGDEAWSYRRTVNVMTQTMHAIHIDEEEAEAEVPEPAAVAEAPAYAPAAQEEEFKLEPVANLDVDQLFNQKIDESQFDDLFSSIDAQDDVFGGSDRVSFDEAINMGILDE